MMYLGTLAKTILGFVSLWALTRVIGQKLISQLTLFDYITGITIGSLTAMVIESPHWKPLLASVLMWGLLTYMLHAITLKGSTIHRVLDGSPIILIRNGKVLEQNLKKAQLNIEELTSMLRAKGYFDVEQVEFALLETNGTLSVQPRSQYRSLQPRDLNVSTGYEGLMIKVMKEGQPVSYGLQQAGLTADWLHQELASRATPPEDVFAAWLTTDGRLLVDRRRQKSTL